MRPVPVSQQQKVPMVLFVFLQLKQHHFAVQPMSRTSTGTICHLACNALQPYREHEQYQACWPVPMPESGVHAILVCSCTEQLFTPLHTCANRSASFCYCLALMQCTNSLVSIGCNVFSPAYMTCRWNRWMWRQTYIRSSVLARQKQALQQPV